MLLKRVTVLMDVDLAALLERAIRQGSLSEVDQYLREAEDHLASLEDAAELTAELIALLEGKLAEHRQKAARLDRAVEAFLLDGNDSGAAASQSRLNSLGHLVESYAAQLREQENTAQQLASAIPVLEARHDALKALRAETQGLLPLAQRNTLHANGAGLAALAASDDPELRQRAVRLAAQLEPLRSTAALAADRHEASLEDVLDQQRVTSQLAQRRGRQSLAL